MSNPVQITKDNEVAILTINNPPVNALSDEVREEIREAFEQIEKDNSVKAVVLIGDGSTFLSDTDINKLVEYTSGKVQRSPALLRALQKIENCNKPVVCAIHGNAFSGGLETAMACHYRVASPGANIGQLEVKLGLIPSAGGTQRLPRLAGVAKAVEMCSLGGAISVEEGLKLGIIDRLIEGDLLSGAVTFARKIAGKPAPKTSERDEKLVAPGGNSQIFASARETVRSKQPGMPAPLAAIDAIEAATSLPFDQGCALEQKLFVDCLFSDPSKSLVHVFFAEREVSYIPNLPKETSMLPIKTAAVVGAGTMGAGIAMVFANAGIPVWLKDVDQAALDRGWKTIQTNYETSVKRRRFTRQFVDERLQMVKPTLTYDDFANADIAIEAVFEGMALKKQVFGELDRVCRRGAILASNTSYLNIDEMASVTSRPADVIGTHFFSPAHVMHLLEIVRARATRGEVIATCMQLAKKLGKTAVLVGNCRGFVGNRMYQPYRRESQFLVEEGAAPQDVDNALLEFGMAMGPLSVGDMSGLDIGWRMRKEYRHMEKPGIRQPFAEDYLCEMGRFGQKTKAGWYKYDDDRRRLPDPEVPELVRKRATEKGITQRQISSQEIVERCIYAMINEGARVLEEGYALRPGDIDVVFLKGYGFPNYRGGPMWYADTVGLKKIYDRICELHRQYGELWVPSRLLEQLAERGKGFADFNKEQPTVL